MGATAYQAFFGGRTPFDDGNRKDSEIDAETQRFASNPNNRVIKPDDRPNGELSDVDNLINELMHPVPENRPSISDALTHLAFMRWGVGSPEVRTLIQKLCDKNTTEDELRQASANV